MDNEEKLDLILNEIKNHYSHLPNESNWQKICRLITDGDGVSTGNPDYENDPRLLNYLNGLSSEGFIEEFYNSKSIPAQKYYISTVKGLLFEGFVNRKDRLTFEQNETRSLKTLETRLKKKVVVQNGWLIGIGIIAAIYYLIEIVKFFYHNKDAIHQFLKCTH